MKSKELVNRIIQSMEEHPDSWKVTDTDYIKKGNIKVRVIKYNWIRLDGNLVVLSWWHGGRLRRAAQKLLMEKAFRALDRSEA